MTAITILLLQICTIIVFFSETSLQVIEPISAGVKLACKKSEQFSQITVVILQLLPSEDNHYKNITCDGKDTDFQFSSLSENTRYTIQSVWVSENTTHYCQVMEFYTRKFCIQMFVF